MLQRYTLYFNYPNLPNFCCEFETEFIYLYWKSVPNRLKLYWKSVPNQLKLYWKSV